MNTSSPPPLTSLRQESEVNELAHAPVGLSEVPKTISPALTGMHSPLKKKRRSEADEGRSGHSSLSKSGRHEHHNTHDHKHRESGSNDRRRRRHHHNRHHKRHHSGSSSRSRSSSLSSSLSPLSSHSSFTSSASSASPSTYSSSSTSSSSPVESSHHHHHHHKHHQKISSSHHHHHSGHHYEKHHGHKKSWGSSHHHHHHSGSHRHSNGYSSGRVTRYRKHRQHKRGKHHDHYQHKHRYNDRRSLEPSRSASSSSSISCSPSYGRRHSCDDSENHLIIYPGDSIGPRYKVLQVMGEGYFSRVVRAHDNTTGEDVAIKIIRAVDRYAESAKIEIQILEEVSRQDPEDKYRIVKYIDNFQYLDHICIVCGLCATSVYDFMTKNNYHPFSMKDIQSISYQLIHSLSYLHSIKLIHTDLKPENMMFMNAEYDEMPLSKDTCANPRGVKEKTTLVPRSTETRLIDLGNGVWNTHPHSSVIGTRHYRAPEVLLGLEWSYPSDMWSVACIMLELYTGDALYMTHSNREHLAMMERVTGPLPRHMISRAHHSSRKYFNEAGRVVFPSEGSHETTKYVDEMLPLNEIIDVEKYPLFFDVVSKLFAYDPDARLTAAQALEHPFFKSV